MVNTLENTDLALNVRRKRRRRNRLIDGTHSGFIGLTALYYPLIAYTLSAVKLHIPVASHR